MALPSSGTLTLSQIEAEVGAVGLIACTNAAFGGAPYSMTRFYGYSKGFSGFHAVLTAHTSNFNLSAWLLTVGWNGVDPVAGMITVNPGVWIGDAGAGWSLRIADLPFASTIDLIVYGTIAGRGGAGGRGGDFNAQNAVAGSGGGGALLIRNTVRLWDKAGSFIVGGGGGGGGGGGAYSTWDGFISATGGGGGGGGQSGYPVTIGGGGGGSGSISVLNNGQPGGGGSNVGPGAGGAAGAGSLGGVGGAGGAWGQPGARGSDAHPLVPLNVLGIGRPGGPAGSSIDGWGYVQHQEHSGTIAGALV